MPIKTTQPLQEVEEGRTMDFLSKDETYGDISSLDEQWNYSLVSITRGCDNMCTFCVVPLPWTRSAAEPKAS
jgi:tRNA-2-methylthio-N6-dimethylallyladenosine synthase